MIFPGSLTTTRPYWWLWHGSVQLLGICLRRCWSHVRTVLCKPFAMAAACPMTGPVGCGFSPYCPNRAVLLRSPSPRNLPKGRNVAIAARFSRYAFALTLPVVVVVSVMSAVPASAATASDNPTESPVQVHNISPATIQHAAVALAGASADLKARASAFMAQRARDGVLVDSKDVRVAHIQDPQTGANIEQVFTSNIEPNLIRVTKQDSTDNSGGHAVDMGLGVAYNEVPGTSPTLSAGAGSGSAVSTNGMYLYSTACVQTFWTPGYATVNNNDHASTSCFQKYAKSGSNVWAYNRWAVFTAAQPSYSGEYIRIMDYTIRSRPWNTQTTQFTGLLDWQPRSGSVSCSENDLTVSASGVSYTAPMYSCSQDFIVYPNASAVSMGAEQDNLPLGQSAKSKTTSDTCTQPPQRPMPRPWPTTNTLLSGGRVARHARPSRARMRGRTAAGNGDIGKGKVS